MVLPVATYMYQTALTVVTLAAMPTNYPSRLIVEKYTECCPYFRMSRGLTIFCKKKQTHTSHYRAQ